MSDLPVIEFNKCDACQQMISMEIFLGHFELCSEIADFGDLEKKVCQVRYFYIQKTAEMYNLVNALKFSNYTVPEGQQYPNVPCYCEDIGGNHTQAECLRKLGIPELKIRVKQLLDEAWELFLVYESFRNKLVLWRINGDDKSTSAKSPERAKIERADVSPPPNRGEDAQKLMRIFVRHLTKSNTETLKAWDKEWRKKTTGQEDTDSECSDVSSPPSPQRSP
ncbi:unnamed protein product [Caenorhabditis brenneri]